MIHPAAGPAWLVWLEGTSVAAAMRQWLWLYPVVEIVHILGFVVLVGAAALFDLRLLGLARQLPVTALARYHLRWARSALFLIVPSGLLMFVAHATEMATNPAFQTKLALIVLAGLNAAAFAPGRVSNRRLLGSRHHHARQCPSRGPAVPGAVDGRDRLRASARLPLAAHSLGRLLRARSVMG